jgi:hypothetical protein
MRALFVLAVTLLVAAPASGAAPAGFRLPSGNIACLDTPGGLRCDILSGLKPEPRRACELDWTGTWLAHKGRASAVCAGDTVFDPRARVLPYGTTWRRNGLTCDSRRTGLTCRNRAGHGFFLSRQRWRLF